MNIYLLLKLHGNMIILNILIKSDKKFSEIGYKNYNIRV